MLEAGKNTVRRKLPGHDAGEEAEDDPDPEHVGDVLGKVEVEVVHGKTGHERPVELERGIEVNAKGQVDDHDIDDCGIGSFAFHLEIMFKINNGDQENPAQVRGDFACLDKERDRTLNRYDTDAVLHPDERRVHVGAALHIPRYVRELRTEQSQFGSCDPLDRIRQREPDIGHVGKLPQKFRDMIFNVVDIPPAPFVSKGQGGHEADQDHAGPCFSRIFREHSVTGAREKKNRYDTRTECTRDNPIRVIGHIGAQGMAQPVVDPEPFFLVLNLPVKFLIALKRIFHHRDTGAGIGTPQSRAG